MNKCNCVSDFMQIPLSDNSLWQTDKIAANDTVLARIYTPKQVSGELYTLCEALSKGTVYPELNQPYICGGNCCSPGADGEEILLGTEVTQTSGDDSDCPCKEKEAKKHGMCKQR